MALHRPERVLRARRPRRPDRLRRGLHGRRRGTPTDLGGFLDRPRRRDRHAGPRRRCRSCARSTCAAPPRREQSTPSQHPRRTSRATTTCPTTCSRLFLDETLSYSSALFDTASESTAATTRGGRAAEGDDVGATSPRRRAARSSGCSTRPASAEGTRVLEIGTGWGELGHPRRPRAARPCTRSPCPASSRRWPSERIAAAGYADRVDGRAAATTALVRATYDAIVSVEMIEAVGHEYWATYFATIDRLLAPGGKVAHPGDHDAPRPDAGHPRHLHLDPQVHLPRRLPALGRRRSSEITRADTSLRVADRLVLRPALRRDAAPVGRPRSWPRTTQVARPRLRRDLRRMWHFYLEYSRAGFASGYLDVQQLMLAREAPMTAHRSTRHRRRTRHRGRCRPAGSSAALAPVRRRRPARCGCAPGTAPRPARVDAPAGRAALAATRCAGCCGTRASSAPPRPTSPASSTSRATSTRR